MEGTKNEKDIDVTTSGDLYLIETAADQTVGHVGNADELQRHLGNRQLQLIAIGELCYYHLIPASPNTPISWSLSSFRGYATLDNYLLITPRWLHRHCSLRVHIQWSGQGRPGLSLSRIRHLHLHARLGQQLPSRNEFVHACHRWIHPHVW